MDSGDMIHIDQNDMTSLGWLAIDKFSFENRVVTSNRLVTLDVTQKIDRHVDSYF